MLSIYQEVLIQELIKRSLRFIEDYMTLKEKRFKKMMKRREDTRRSSKYISLPDNYFDGLSTSNVQSRDISNYELYKIIMHFRCILDKPLAIKAEQYLLKSGLAPNRTIFRTYDPDASNKPNSSQLSSEPARSSF